MDPKDRFIKELLDVHGKEEKNPEHVPQWWDHPAQKDPMLIHMSWEQIRKIVLNLFPQIGMKDIFLEIFREFYYENQNHKTISRFFKKIYKIKLIFLPTMVQTWIELLLFQLEEKFREIEF